VKNYLKKLLIPLIIVGILSAGFHAAYTAMQRQLLKRGISDFPVLHGIVNTTKVIKKFSY